MSSKKAFIHWLRWKVCRKELEALGRYRTACQEVEQWTSYVSPRSAATAKYIHDVGEDKIGLNTSKFRHDVLPTLYAFEKSSHDVRREL